MISASTDSESRRPTLYGSRQAVSSGHYLASAAAFAILQNGGNAIDAGVCAGICLAVVHSNEVNFAGVAPIIIRTAEGRVVNLPGLGHWPASLPVDYFLREHAGLMPHGVTCTVVPAAPATWIQALNDFGTLTFSEVSAEAIRFARDGFSIYQYFHDEVTAYEAQFSRWESNRRIYLPNGRPPAVGERFIQEDLAATIEAMAGAEASAGGSRSQGLRAAHDAFYRGDIAEAIVEHQRELGGFLSREDLAGFEARYEAPVSMRWRDQMIYTCGPWSQGPMLAQSLRMLDLLGIEGMEREDPEYVHRVLEVLKSAFADREYHFGDPVFTGLDIQRLLSEEYLRRRIAHIRSDVAHLGMPEPLDAAEGILDLIPAPTHKGSAGRAPDTSYVCVVDRWGNAFSATPSDGAYEAPVVPGTGVVPSMRGAQSRPDPRHPAGAAPGRRPRLTPNPALSVGDDGSFAVFGAPGGDMQVQAMLQVFLNVFHFNMEVQAAIDAPRFSTWNFPNSFAPFEFLENRVAVESRVSESLRASLSAKGHDLQIWPSFTRSAAAVEFIQWDASTKFLRAGADPRQPAYAIVS